MAILAQSAHEAIMHYIQQWDAMYLACTEGEAQMEGEAPIEAQVALRAQNMPLHIALATNNAAAISGVVETIFQRIGEIFIYQAPRERLQRNVADLVGFQVSPNADPVTRLTTQLSVFIFSSIVI